MLFLAALDWSFVEQSKIIAKQKWSMKAKGLNTSYPSNNCGIWWQAIIIKNWNECFCLRPTWIRWMFLGLLIYINILYVTNKWMKKINKKRKLLLPFIVLHMRNKFDMQIFMFTIKMQCWVTNQWEQLSFDCYAFNSD